MAKFSDSIKNAMQTALETIARKAYNESAANIPSYNRNQQQAILSSRYITTTSDRVEYGFTHPDADVLEDGKPAENIQGRYTQNVNRHRRRTKRGRNTTVRKHTRTYQDQKPVLMPDGNWAIVSTIPAVEGTNWLQTTADKWFSDENVGTEFKNNLER